MEDLSNSRTDSGVSGSAFNISDLSSSSDSLDTIEDGKEVLEGPSWTEAAFSPIPSILPNGSIPSNMNTGFNKAGDQATRPRLKKSVSFCSEESLVQIMEIPAREDSPLEQELVPCDPRKLSEQIENGDFHRFSLCRSFDVLTSLSGRGFGPHSKPMALARPTGTRPSSGGVIPKRGQVSGNRIERISKSGNAWSKSGPINNRNHVAGSTLFSNSTVPQRANQNQKNQHQQRSSFPESRYRKKPLSAPPGGSRTMSNINSSPDKGHGSVGPQSVCLKSRGAVRSMITLDTKTLKAAGVQLRVSGESVLAKSRLLPSPYRQSSAPPTRHEGLNRTGYELSDTKPVSPRKMHAWQVANCAPRNTQVNTPCISQMWDSTSFSSDKIQSST